MKVYIGPYKNFFYRYKFERFLERKLKLSEKTSELISSCIPFNLIVKLQGSDTRKVKVSIHKHDVWNGDETLAHIILPILKETAKYKGGMYIDPEDLPEHIRDKSAFEQTAWLFEELIWSFESVIDESDYESYLFDKYEGRFDLFKSRLQEYQDRQRRGLILFGKYYRNLLWT